MTCHSQRSPRPVFQTTVVRFIVVLIDYCYYCPDSLFQYGMWSVDLHWPAAVPGGLRVGEVQEERETQERVLHGSDRARHHSGPGACLG